MRRRMHLPWRGIGVPHRIVLAMWLLNAAAAAIWLLTSFWTPMSGTLAAADGPTAPGASPAQPATTSTCLMADGPAVTTTTTAAAPITTQPPPSTTTTTTTTETTDTVTTTVIVTTTVTTTVVGTETLTTTLTTTTTTTVTAEPCPSPPAASHTITVSTTGPGSASPGSGIYVGTAAFTATPSNSSSLFLGWMVDGSFVGFGNPLTLPVTKDYTVVATFAAIPPFCDVTASTPNYAAIVSLAARGFIKGSDNPNGPGRCFLPDDTLLRIHVAGFVARAFGWDQENHGNAFTDQGSVDPDLWRNAGTLAFYDVARGYRDGTFDPLGPVLRAQAISFVTRAMVRTGYWTLQEDNPAYYTALPTTSGHRQDAVTFYTYAGNIPGTSAPTDSWGDPNGYDSPATRAYFAQVLWQALSSYFSTNHVP